MRTKWSSFIVVFVLFLEIASVSSVFAQSSNPVISSISDNRSSYSSSQIPMYEKFEITFQVQTNAQNLQLPFDNAPPPGVTPGQGISVNAVFTDPTGKQFKQPAFYYQDFDYQVKSNQDWIYPKNSFSWKVRFSPNKIGNWKYSLTAQDANGITTSPEQAFTVSASTNHGFLRVSKTDSRYFEFDDGTYFPGLGINNTWNQVSFDDPVTKNTSHFTSMGQNGIQLDRIWLSQWSIFTAAWTPWASIDPAHHANYIGWNFTDADSTVPPPSETTMNINNNMNPCMFIGFGQKSPAVKKGSSYRVKVRFKTQDLGAPQDSTKPYGFVVKTGGWLDTCYQSGTGKVVTPYISINTATTSTPWQILEGRIPTVSGDFLEGFYLTLENIQYPKDSSRNTGVVFIDYVWIEEDLGNGQYGPNIVMKPWMSQHLYFQQRDSYALDKVLDLAKQYGVYLKPVVLEKNEEVFNYMDYDGTFIPKDMKCWDNDPTNDPPKCPSNNNFYGNWRTMTKSRWLQQAWWRYLQARWGYSTQIHSWELLNEGDPYNGLHFTMLDEFGKYMHCRAFGVAVGSGDNQKCIYDHPNDHMVSTSTWHSFPESDLWMNSSFPNIDFSDVHFYQWQGTSLDLQINKPGGPSNIHVYDPADFYETALANQKLAMLIGAKQPYGVNKPVVRGEMGFVDSNADWNHGFFAKDTQGIWLHNFVWGHINAGGMYDLYWYSYEHIYPLDSYILNLEHYSAPMDLRPVYKPYYNFIKDISLSNGRYVDSGASSANS